MGGYSGLSTNLFVLLRLSQTPSYQGRAFKAVVMDTDLEPGRSFAWGYKTRTLQGLVLNILNPIYDIPQN